MSKRTLFIAAAFSLTVVVLFLNSTRSGPVAETISAAERYGTIPLHFEKNVGQADADFRYLARGKGYSMMLADARAVVALQDHGRSAAIEMAFVGAVRNPEITAEGELEGKANYITGSDPSQWRTDIATFERVRYRELYPGIDLIFYGNQQELEFDLVVDPGPRPMRSSSNCAAWTLSRSTKRRSVISRGRNEIGSTPPRRVSGH